MMKIRKLMPFVLALLLAGALVAYGPTLAERAAYAVAAGQNLAAREQLAQLSKHDQMSELFRTVAKAVRPAVVVVHVKQKIEYRPPGGVPEFFNDDFFRRFFGEDMPERFRRQRPAPSPEEKAPGQPEPKQEYFARGLGSGVIVDAKNGYIITNWHVVRDADKVEIVLHDNRRLTAEWIKTDRLSDLAVIKVRPERLIDAPLGNSDNMEVGDLVLAVGAPEGLQQTVTAGIISAKGRTTGGGMSYQDFIQTDAAINHGNSGGPLVNMRGEVIGINSAIISRTGVNEGIGLTVPSNMVRSIMGQLIDKGKVVRGYLGVRIQNVDEGLAKSFKLPNMEGALVSQVAEGGPAEKARMQSGDFITKVNGERIRNVNELRNAVAELAPGKSHPFEVYRDGKAKTLNVKIEPQPEDMAGTFGEETTPGTAEASKYGFKVATLTDPTRQKYGYKDDVKGVVIVEVSAEAAEQGLAEGMVILQVQGKAVSTAAEFEKAISGQDAKDGARLQVTDRTGAKRFLFVSPER